MRRRLIVCLVLLFCVATVTVWAARFLDDFTRADNTDLGASWDAGYTGAQSLQIVGNEVRPLLADPDFSHETVNTSFGNDQRASLTIRTFTGAGTDVAAAHVRNAAPATRTAYYCAAKRNGAGGVTSEIVELTAGTDVSLTSETSTTWAAGDQLICEVQGTALRLFRIPSGGSQVLLLSTTDASIASGRVGISMYTANTVADNEIDNFAATDNLSGASMSLTGIGQ